MISGLPFIRSKLPQSTESYIGDYDSSRLKELYEAMILNEAGKIKDPKEYAETLRYFDEEMGPIRRYMETQIKLDRSYGDKEKALSTLLKLQEPAISLEDLQRLKKIKGY